MPPDKILRAKLKERTLEHLNRCGYVRSLYIPLDGRILGDSGRGEDLYSLVKTSFLAHSSQEQALLLTGTSGAGKTRFGQFLVDKLWNEYREGDPIPLWIPLAHTKGSSFLLLENHLRYNLKLFNSEIETILSKESLVPLCIVGDGYDEISTSINLHQINKWEELNIKATFTCRSEEFKRVSYQLLLKLHNNKIKKLLCYEILPFNNMKINRFIDRYLNKLNIESISASNSNHSPQSS